MVVTLEETIDELEGKFRLSKLHSDGHTDVHSSVHTL